jgi:hypothetical protein
MQGCVHHIQFAVGRDGRLRVLLVQCIHCDIEPFHCIGDVTDSEPKLVVVRLHPEARVIERGAVPDEPCRGSVRINPSSASRITSFRK